MTQLSLFETGIGVEFHPNPDQTTAIIFKEYEPITVDEKRGEVKMIPTGRRWSGELSDRELFDLLLKNGKIAADILELETGLRNIPLITGKKAKSGGT